jgi:membrane fusion protein (multidrug efflux system)
MAASATHTSGPRRWRYAVALVVGLVVLWIAISALRGSRIAPGLVGQSIEPIPNVARGIVLSQQVPLRRELIGAVQSSVTVDAASRVAARIAAIPVHAGDRVQRGQVLAALDASDLRAGLAQARAQLEAARGQLHRAAADEQRFAALFARGSVTASEHDAAEAAYRGALGQVGQAEAAVAAARASLVYATVRSPVDGVVVERLAEPGDMAMPGRPLVRLYDTGALRVELEVAEDLARKIELGTPLLVRVDAIGTTYRTRVNEIVPASDPLNRSFLVRAPLPSGGHLQPGMFARAALTIGSEQVLTAPADAIQQVGQLYTVRVITDGRIETRMVALGRSFHDRVEILAGLQPGQRVLLDREADKR